MKTHEKHFSAALIFSGIPGSFVTSAPESSCTPKIPQAQKSCPGHFSLLLHTSTARPIPCSPRNDRNNHR
eukprot:1216437-Amphidinium_carterae.1